MARAPSGVRSRSRIVIMKSTSDQLDRLVRAVHQRAVGWRLVESMGLGVVVGAAMGSALSAVMWWRESDGSFVALGAIGLGGLAGLMHGLARRPSPLDAAGEADRQLRLHDLLATALTVRTSSDPW